MKMNATSVIVPALVITTIFFVIKYFTDTRNAKKTEGTVPGRSLIRDSVLVCVSSIVGLLIYNQFVPVQSVVKTAMGTGSSNAAVFTEKPNF